MRCGFYFGKIRDRCLDWQLLDAEMRLMSHKIAIKEVLLAALAEVRILGKALRTHYKRAFASVDRF